MLVQLVIVMDGAILQLETAHRKMSTECVNNGCTTTGTSYQVQFLLYLYFDFLVLILHCRTRKI